MMMVNDKILAALWWNHHLDCLRKKLASLGKIECPFYRSKIQLLRMLLRIFFADKTQKVQIWKVSAFICAQLLHYGCAIHNLNLNLGVQSVNDVKFHLKKKMSCLWFTCDVTLMARTVETLNYTRITELFLGVPNVFWSQTPVHDRARRCMPMLLQSKGAWTCRPSLISFWSWSRECRGGTSANRPGTQQRPRHGWKVTRNRLFFLEENQSCSLTFNAIEWRFLFCSLPKPCAACHTGKVGNMELQSRSKRRSQMPMCPPDISTGTPWKKWVDSSLNRIRPRNQQEHGLQKKTCVLLCGWTWGNGCCSSLCHFTSSALGVSAFAWPLRRRSWCISNVVDRCWWLLSLVDAFWGWLLLICGQMTRKARNQGTRVPKNEGRKGQQFTGSIKK